MLFFVLCSICFFFLIFFFSIVYSCKYITTTGGVGRGVIGPMQEATGAGAGATWEAAQEPAQLAQGLPLLLPNKNN